MTNQRSRVEEIFSTLKRERDELKVRIHLAGMDAKKEYERLTSKVDELAEQWEPVKNIATETADNVFAAFALAAGEMKQGLSRVRKELEK